MLASHDPSPVVRLNALELTLNQAERRLLRRRLAKLETPTAVRRAG